MGRDLQPGSEDVRALLDGLDDQPVPVLRREPAWGSELRIVSELPALPYQAEALASIPGESTKRLLMRVETTDKPAVLWALHAELDDRGIPPCVRPAQRIGTEQAAFITTLADLLWIARRHPGHAPLKKRMSRITRGEPNTDVWHRAALWAHQESRGKPYTLAKWLGFTDAQRAQTATMPAKAQSNERRALPDQLEAIYEALLDHALDHPDKSGRVRPDDVAKRRTKLVRLFVLLGRSVPALHEHLQAVEGIKTSVQATRNQIDAIATIYGPNKAPLAPPRVRSRL